MFLSIKGPKYSLRSHRHAGVLLFWRPRLELPPIKMRPLRHRWAWPQEGLWRVCARARSVLRAEPFDSRAISSRKAEQLWRDWERGSRSFSTRRACWATCWAGWRPRPASAGPTSPWVGKRGRDQRLRAHAALKAVLGLRVRACARASGMRRSRRVSLQPWWHWSPFTWSSVTGLRCSATSSASCIRPTSRE